MTATTTEFDGHRAITNHPPESITVTPGAVQEPAQGQEPPNSSGAADGVELVDGHTHADIAIEELWTAPTATLPDIAEASFGRMATEQETVHGPDDRVRITDPSTYPWRAHASLLITAADGSTWIGTGWFIGPHTLMTAGHVVYITNSGVAGRDGWVRSINVMPGRNETSLPYGQVTSTTFWTVTGWSSSGDQTYDYGAIIIPTDLGSTVGWFGFGVYADEDLTDSTVNISGYPGDKPSGTQWYDNQKVASVDSRKVFYDIDTFGGQSGSAVYRIIDGHRYGVAVHAYGGATTNSGTRITTPMFDNMVAWKA